MKTAKLIIGIISIVLTLLIVFQSLAATVGDAIAGQGGTSGGAGIAVAALMLIAGITAIAARNSRGGGIFCLIAYAIAGILGVTAKGVYGDLVVWGALSLIFAVFFLLSTITFRKAAKSEKTENQ
jgi:hypothetical protein